MNKETSLIHEAFEILQDLRVKVQGDLDDSAIYQLDRVISKLEEASRNRQDQIAKEEVLELLGKAIKFIPAVAKLIEILSNLL
ncbi:MAG: hypothetical protein WBC91_20795 [Phototrophicaceae bacterium]